jgi:hypothetical protein
MEDNLVKAAANLFIMVFCLSIMVFSNQSQASPSQAKQGASPAAEKWEYYATDEEETEYFYNVNNIEHLKNTLVRVWVQAIYTEKNQKYTMGRFQWEIDCSKKRMRGLQAFALKKDKTTTSVNESSRWSTIPAASTAETLYETVCKKPVKKQDEVTDKKAEEMKTEEQKAEEKKVETKVP